MRCDRQLQIHTEDHVIKTDRNTFWKIIAFIHDETKKLCATGYTMSQESYLKEEEFVF
jgi:hypothetical protein